MTIHEAIVQLSPWTQHHPKCARVTSAAACDCGLQAVLRQIAAADQIAESFPENRSLKQGQFPEKR